MDRQRSAGIIGCGLASVPKIKAKDLLALLEGIKHYILAIAGGL